MRRLFQKIFRCCLAVAALPLGVLLASPASAGGIKDDLIREQFALGPETVEALKNRCEDTSTGTECLRLLRTIYAPPRALDTDALSRAKTRNIRNMLAEMIVSRQNAVLPEGAIPARFRPLGNGSLVHLEPQVALSPGVTYQVLLEGLPVRTLQTGTSSPALRSSMEASFREATSGRELSELEVPLAKLQRQLEDQAETATGVPTLAGMRILLEHELTAAELEKLRVGFLPVAEPSASITSLSIADSVGALRARHDALDTLPCSPVALRADRMAPGAEKWRGRFPSLDESGSIVWLPFLIALPAPGEEAIDFVFLVDGLGGSMERFATDQIRSLRARGLGVVAVELPAHGMRYDGDRYMNAQDPARLARFLQLGALDVAAAIRQVRQCGLAVPGDRAPTAGAIRYLGYSLGGMTGILVRAIVPEIDRMALVAPSADLADWLLLQVVAGSGVPMLTCLGGKSAGENCFGHGQCPGGGCVIDPLLQSASRHLRWSWQVAAAGADPADYASRPAGDTKLLIVSGGKDGILAPRQTYRLAEALGMKPAGPHRWSGDNTLLEEWPDLDHGLISDPEVRARVQNFLAAAP